jgi:hypothetical protein
LPYFGVKETLLMVGALDQQHIHETVVKELAATDPPDPVDFHEQASSQGLDQPATSRLPQIACQKTA